MPATDVKFGITRHTGALIDSVETTEKVEKKELAGSDGEIARVHTYRTSTAFTVKGHGALTVTPGVGSSGITDLAGGLTIIEEVKRTESNDDFDGWEYSGMQYPSAQQV